MEDCFWVRQFQWCESVVKTCGRGSEIWDPCRCTDSCAGEDDDSGDFAVFDTVGDGLHVQFWALVDSRLHSVESY